MLVTADNMAPNINGDSTTMVGILSHLFSFHFSVIFLSKHQRWLNNGRNFILSFEMPQKPLHWHDHHQAECLVCNRYGNIITLIMFCWQTSVKWKYFCLILRVKHKWLLTKGKIEISCSDSPTRAGCCLAMCYHMQSLFRVGRRFVKVKVMEKSVKEVVGWKWR